MENDRLTMKWLSNAVAEIRTEVVEVQAAINSTLILQDHEELNSELTLLKSDVSYLNGEVEISRNRNLKLEAEVSELKEEMKSLKEQARTTSVLCGRTKNQVSERNCWLIITLSMRVSQ